MEMRPFAVYAASKVEGEKAAWKWVQTKQPGFVLNTVLPSFNVSPPHISRLLSKVNRSNVRANSLGRSCALRCMARPWDLPENS
jgi:hypothetical protein